MVKIKNVHQATIDEAAAILKSGGLVAMPTETVYGLAADACNGEAVARIFEAKGRPSFNPLIVHIAHSRADQPGQIHQSDLKNTIASQILRCVKYNSEQQRQWFEVLAHEFWPGPLTMILPRADDCPISELASAGLDTIALRMPAHPAAQQLLTAFGGPLVAPSANPSGMLSPTTPEHVVSGLGDRVDMILAAGACKIGLESTVIDLSGDVPTILRAGSIMAEDIDNVLHNTNKGEGVVPAGKKYGPNQSFDDSFNENVNKNDYKNSPVSHTFPPALRYVKLYERGDARYDKNEKKPRAPGMLLKHYAPRTPVRLHAYDVKVGEALLAFGSDQFMALEGGGAAKDLPNGWRLNLSEGGDLYEAAANLFAHLHRLDQVGAKAIAVMQIPETGLGIAINDRLRRAAAS